MAPRSLPKASGVALPAFDRPWRERRLKPLWIATFRLSSYLEFVEHVRDPVSLHVD